MTENGQQRLGRTFDTRSRKAVRATSQRDRLLKNMARRQDSAWLTSGLSLLLLLLAAWLIWRGLQSPDPEEVQAVDPVPSVTSEIVGDIDKDLQQRESFRQNFADFVEQDIDDEVSNRLAAAQDAQRQQREVQIEAEIAAAQGAMREGRLTGSDGAIARWQELRRQAPDNPLPAEELQRIASALVRDGLKLVRAGNYDLAEQRLQSALLADPASTAATNGLVALAGARASEQEKSRLAIERDRLEKIAEKDSLEAADWDQARALVATLRASDAIDTQSVDAIAQQLTERAIALAETREQRTAAMQDFARAMALSPTPEVVSSIADEWLAKRLAAEAVPSIDDAAEAEQDGLSSNPPIVSSPKLEPAQPVEEGVEQNTIVTSDDDSAVAEEAAQPSPEPPEATNPAPTLIDPDVSYDVAYDNFINGNYRQAQRALTTLSGQGDSRAQFLLAVMYSEGLGVPRDNSAAEQELARSVARLRTDADAGESWAQYGLGVMYEKGWLVSASDQQAFRWYRQAAASGDAEAQYRIGLLMRDNQQLQRLDERGYEQWLQAAANQGHRLAQQAL
ncbi:hypothetical protein OAS86_02085 [Gammaproteobacteria bacterium]|nr:hypothetical protein [Gammaproteobacteria bacterium]